jgi:hypothetical protein
MIIVFLVGFVGTMCYMELSMRLVAAVNLLDWVIYTIKISRVLYVDVEESILFS